MARIVTQQTTMQQRDIPINPDTRQHLRQFYLNRQTFTQTPKKEKESRLPFGSVESSLPRPSVWSRLAPTPSVAREPSPALLARTRGSTTPPSLPRLPVRASARASEEGEKEEEEEDHDKEREEEKKAASRESSENREQTRLQDRAQSSPKPSTELSEPLRSELTRDPTPLRTDSF